MIKDILPQNESHLNGHSAVTKQFPSRPRFNLTSLSELLSRPDAEYLIDDFIVEATTVALTGDSEAFKTFAALDMALCIATGTPWHGREVKQGPVVYIVAEGGWAIKVRIKAWLQAHGFSQPPSDREFRMLESAIPVNDKVTMEAFTAELVAFQPRFVVIDTLSTCSEGMNENANHEMAAFVAGMTGLSRATGATVAAIHHHGQNGKTRGATSLKNNVDTLIVFERAEPEESRITQVSCEKHRGAKFESFALHGAVVRLPDVDKQGRNLTSLVLQPVIMPEKAKAKQHANAERASKSDQRLLEAFDRIAAEYPEGVKAGTWAATCAELEICSERTVFRRMAVLLEAGVIELCGDHQSGNLYRRAMRTDTTDRTARSVSVSCVREALIPTDTTDTIPLGSVSCVSVSARAKNSVSNGAKPKKKVLR